MLLAVCSPSHQNSNVCTIHAPQLASCVDKNLGQKQSRPQSLILSGEGPAPSSTTCVCHCHCRQSLGFSTQPLLSSDASTPTLINCVAANKNQFCFVNNKITAASRSCGCPISRSVSPSIPFGTVICKSSSEKNFGQPTLNNVLVSSSYCNAVARSKSSM